jgi:hypothetical protein
MSEVDHQPCIEALERLEHQMKSAIARANEQIADTEARLARLDQANEALAKTQTEMLREIRKLLECGRPNDALRYVHALCEAVGVTSH